MREIYLTNNDVAIVDDEDHSYLNQWSWNNYQGYARRTDYSTGRAITIRMHREIMNCFDGKYIVDHINHNTLDNRKGNLRVCNKSQNLMNQIKKDNKATSKFKGVRYLSTNGYYQVRITKDKITKLIGHFTCEIASANAYNYHAKQLHGEFCCLNDVSFMSKKEWESYGVKKGENRK